MGTRTFNSRRWSLADSCASTVNIHTKLQILLPPLQLCLVDINSSNISKLGYKTGWKDTVWADKMDKRFQHTLNTYTPLFCPFISDRRWSTVASSSFSLSSLRFFSSSDASCMSARSLSRFLVKLLLNRFSNLFFSPSSWDTQMFKLHKQFRPHGLQLHTCLFLSMFSQRNQLKKKKAAMLVSCQRHQRCKHTHTKQKRCAAA